MKDMYDLGQPYDSNPTPKEANPEKVSYPTLFVSGSKGLDLPEGEFTFTAKGKVVSKTERVKGKGKTCDYEIEVHSIQPGGKAPKGKELEKGLSDAFDKMEDDAEGETED